MHGERIADPAQNAQDAEIAPPALNASGLTRPERLQRPASGAPSDKCRDLISHWSVSRV
jgi:hypothetical protein